MRSQRLQLGLVVALAAALAACGELSAEEAREGLDEAALSSAALALAGTSIDLSTNFTIGDAADAAATELQAFVESQLPCAIVTVQGATITIQYGVLPGNCVYRGQHYSGRHEITFMATAASEIVVEHQWTDLNNGTVDITGSAMVTWSAADPSRHVSYDMRWTRMSDNHRGNGTGDVTQRPLETGLLSGFSENGERTWSTQSADWTLTVSNVEMRWVDPCPQSGSYTLTSPTHKTMTLTFVRTDATTIRATIASGSRSFDIDVHAI